MKSYLILVTVPHVNKMEHALSLEVKISSVPVHQVSLQLPFKLLASINVIRYCNSSLGCVLDCVGNHVRFLISHQK